MPVTIKQIAKEASVSHGAVSAVLNDRKGSIRVSDDTRQRIIKAAEDMGYRRNSLAAGLRGGKTQSIGVIWPFEDTARGDSFIGMKLLRSLQDHGYATMHADHRTDINKIIETLDDFAARRVDGVVICSFAHFLNKPEIYKRINRLPSSLVVCQEFIDEIQCDQLVHDRVPAIEQVADYLFKVGIKRPGIGLCMHEPDNHLKYHAFRDRWLALGGEDHKHLLLDFGFTNQCREDKVWRSLKRLFEEGCDVDAIFCINDMNAMYASRFVTNELGLKVPDDIAIVGMNNIEIGKIWDPPLATITRNRTQLVEMAEKMLFARIANPKRKQQKENVAMEFIWRQSAGPALQ